MIPKKFPHHHVPCRYCHRLDYCCPYPDTCDRDRITCDRCQEYKDDARRDAAEEERERERESDYDDLPSAEEYEKFGGGV